MLRKTQLSSNIINEPQKYVEYFILHFSFQSCANDWESKWFDQLGNTISREINDFFAQGK